MLILILGYIPRVAKNNLSTFEKVWAFALILNFSYEQFTMINGGWWSLQWSLPLQMCSLSGMLTIITLLTKNKWTYLFVLFWGLSGGFHSFATPEMTLGGQGILFFTYYFWHASIIVMPMYFFFIKKWQVPKKAFWVVWGSTHLVWLVVGLIDYAVDANYMYVLRPPAVENPFIIGGFPYHLIGFDIAGFLHFGLISFAFRKIQRFYLPDAITSALPKSNI